MHMTGVDAKVCSRSMQVMWEMVGGRLLRLMPFGKVELDYDIMPFGKVESDCDITPFGKVKSDCDITPFGRVKSDCDIMGRAGC